MQSKDIPEGRGSKPAGALAIGSPLDAAREATPGSAVPGSVVHCKRDPFQVYIGRPSTFGNPHPIRRGRTREEAIKLFEQTARKRLAVDEVFRERVRELYGKTLGCYCAPLACHGDVLLKLAAELHANVGGRADVR